MTIDRWRRRTTRNAAIAPPSSNRRSFFCGAYSDSLFCFLGAMYKYRPTYNSVEFSFALFITLCFWMFFLPCVKWPCNFRETSLYCFLLVTFILYLDSFVSYMYLFVLVEVRLIKQSSTLCTCPAFSWNCWFRFCFHHVVEQAVPYIHNTTAFTSFLCE